MALSSHSLFHYTRRLETLKLILQNGFRFSQCLEELPGQGYSQYVDRYINPSSAICFCDIPLSQSASHRTQYGNYLIAMAKPWAINVGITPIRYLHSHSPDIRAFFFRRMHEIAFALSQLDGGVFEFYCQYLKELGFEHSLSFEKFIMNSEPGMRQVMALIEDDYTEMIEAYSRLIGLSRIYEGDWEDRETRTKTTRRFYEEREWRALSLSQNEDNLIFRFSDINYLIVRDESEQYDLIQFLISEREGVLEPLLVPENPGLLYSKILTANTIFPDL